MDYKISRSKIDLYLECPRCFFLDVTGEAKRPSGPGFSLNTAVDELLKKEFDLLREEKRAHSLMEKYNINAIPFSHPNLNEYRHNFTGVRFTHPSGVEFFGAVDDLWIDNDTQEIYVVDYKATSTQGDVTLDGEYKEGYKRQIEVYQYLLTQNNFKVSNTGYFVYANAKKDLEKFDNVLVFDVKILPYDGNNEWVEKTIERIVWLLTQAPIIPLPNPNCKYCSYIKKYNQAILQEKQQPLLFE